MTLNKAILIAVDPSVNNMGVAVFSIDSKKLLMWQLLHPSKDCRDNQYDKSLSLYNKVREWIVRWRVTHMILEVPEYWAVAGFQARETGSIFKLTFVCGVLYSLKAKDLQELKVVTPREWKGQLPKEVVENRLRNKYLTDVDLKEINDNVVDAIGIGHFYLHGRV